MAVAGILGPQQAAEASLSSLERHSAGFWQSLLVDLQASRPPFSSPQTETDHLAPWNLSFLIFCVALSMGIGRRLVGRLMLLATGTNFRLSRNYQIQKHVRLAHRWRRQESVILSLQG